MLIKSYEITSFINYITAQYVAEIYFKWIMSFPPSAYSISALKPILLNGENTTLHCKSLTQLDKRIDDFEQRNDNDGTRLDIKLLVR